jgi:hypothetical protein
MALAWGMPGARGAEERTAAPNDASAALAEI